MTKPPHTTHAAAHCSICGHDNTPGALMCGRCGNVIRRVGTRGLLDETLYVGQRALIHAPHNGRPDSDPSVRFTPGMMLVLTVNHENATVPVRVRVGTQEVLLGRYDPLGGITPEVDLDEFYGYRMGVSRKHATVRCDNGHLLLHDLGSYNGTFINGIRIPPQMTHPLADGDELQLGQLEMRVSFARD